MLASTLIVLAVFVFFLILVAGGVILFILAQRQKVEAAAARNQEFTRRQESAIWASAMIVNARGGVMGSETGVSQWARYELSLQVTPPNGEPYSARTAWLVEVTQMSMLQQGQMLQVKIDQQDPHIIYPNASWAKYIPA